MSHPTVSVTSARQLKTPLALSLADLAAIFDDLQFTLRCCERLLAELDRGPQSDPAVVEALWVSALNSYARCFRPGDRGMGLTEADLKATGVEGDVVEWHGLLRKIRKFMVLGGVNPRETYSIGVTQDATGQPEGIVITSAVSPIVDDVTVRQTGRLAFELGKLVDERIKEHQKKVFDAVENLPRTRLDELPEIEITS